MENIAVNKRHLPPALRDLPVIRAEVAYTIAPGSPMPSLEGPAFDRQGNFYCCHTAPNNTMIKKITPDGQITDFYHCTKGMTVGLAFHKDGRVFAANMMAHCIHILSAEGEEIEIVPTFYEGEGLNPDCMVFRNGDLYFTDLRGTFRNPIGGVYYLTAESGYHTVEKFLGDLASPDGIGFSPNGRNLYISEPSSNSTLRFLLMPDGKPRIAQHTPIQMFRNDGASNVDSHDIDENGYIYLGIMMGGRAVILDPDGIPVANILVPGFEDGKLLYSPNLALSREKAEGYLLASDSERAVVLRFPALAPGRQLYGFE